MMIKTVKETIIISTRTERDYIKYGGFFKLYRAVLHTTQTNVKYRLSNVRT